MQGGAAFVSKRFISWRGLLCCYQVQYVLDMVPFRCIFNLHFCVSGLAHLRLISTSANKRRRKQSTETRESLCWPVCFSPDTFTAKRCERKQESVYLHVSARWLTDRPPSRSSSVGQHDSCPEDNRRMEWTDAPWARQKIWKLADSLQAGIGFY